MKALRILLWMVWRGMVRPRVRLITFVCIFAVALMVFLPLEVYGVLFGLYAVQRQIVLEDPLTLCLWVGLPGLQDQVFTPERKEQLKRLLTGESGLSGWYFFHEIDIFFGLLPDPSAGSLSVTGRTRDPEDPVLTNRTPQTNDKSSSGLYVSRKLLEQLGWRPNEPEPRELFIEAPNRELVSVPVAAIYDELPWGHKFVVDKNWYANFLQEHADVRCAILVTGPIPADWPPPGQLPKLVRTAFDTYRMFVPQKADSAWRIETWRENGYHIRDWTTFLQKINSLMTTAGFSSANEEFWKMARPINQQVNPHSLPAENMGAIYVKDVNHLRSLKQKLEQNGFYVRDTNDTINRLEQLNRSNLIQAGFVTAFLVLIFTGLMLVLTAVQTLRTDAKMAQIGLLKAIGMSERFLRWMFITESLIIWFLGTIVAVITSFLLGKYAVAPALIPEASRYASLAFQFSPAMVSTIACSVAGCWIVMTVLTTRKAIGTSPARLLQTL